MNINYACPINHTGYGLAGSNILKELIKFNEVTLLPIGGNSIVSNKEEYDIMLSLVNKKHNCDITAPYIKVWHQFDLFDHFGKGKYYAFPFFELDKFNSYELNSMKVPDVFFVTSKWAKQILIDNNITQPIEVIPLGVDRNIFNESIEQTETQNKYTFINIGKWEIRKGHDILLKLFNAAFPKEKDVELIIIASENTSSYSSAKELDQWKNMYNQDRIKVIPGLDTQNDIAKIIAKSDCGIFPSRAEGWNLEALEVLSMGKPLIVTNYSGHTQFCNNENSYLIEITEKESAFDGKAFVGQGNWAKIDKKQFDQTVDYMRYVYKNNIKNNINGINTAKTFSWESSARIITRCISQ
jgi:glycosyltransferase involved in cell wall biosynthesis